MERLRRLTTLWNWLPAFRAVAETQHLPAASKQLHVSPSALSRTIRLLEEDVGQPLFNRVGRGIELNATGHRLLSAVRDSMRLVDEALGAMAAKQFVGAVKIASFEPLTTRYVLPALARLQAQHPELLPHLFTTPSELHNTALLQGRLDLALAIDPRPHDDITTHKLKALTCSIYVGAGHPLHGTTPTRDEILEHRFVAPEDTDGLRRDGWPADVRRTVALHADLGTALEVVRSGAYVGILPDELAAPYPELSALQRGVSEVVVYALLRKSLGFEGRAEAVISAVESELG